MSDIITDLQKIAYGSLDGVGRDRIRKVCERALTEMVLRDEIESLQVTLVGMREEAAATIERLRAECERRWALFEEAAHGRQVAEGERDDWQEAAESARAAAFREAAEVARAYAETNLEMAGDSVLADPILHGGPFTPDNIKKSEGLQIDGCIHSSMYHAANNIAEAIEALDAKAKEDTTT